MFFLLCLLVRLVRLDMPLIKKWGGAAWIFLHSAAYQWPEQPTMDDRMRMYNFLRALPFVLPCDKCQKHALKFVHRHVTSPSSEPLSSRDSLARFMNAFHNNVNKRLGRPLVAYDDATRLFVEGGTNGGVHGSVLFVLLGVMFVAVAYFLANKKRTGRVSS